MTKPLRAAVEIILKCLGDKRKILEIGSRQAINQNEMANLRNLFTTGKYIGIDMEDGPGVDMIAQAEKLPFKDGTFDLVICLETLEHAEKPWLICAEIERVLKPNGMTIVSGQQNFPIHMHPSDYFRLTPYGMSILFSKLKSKLVFAISVPFGNEVKLNPQHVVLVGIKNSNEKLVQRIKRALRKNIDLISVHKPYRHRLEEVGRLLRRTANELRFRLEIEFFS